MAKSFEVKTVLPATPEQVYAAWLDSTAHGEMTGGAANTSAEVGAAHSAWDGYITGKNLALKPGARILQSWRSEEFPDDAPDSTIEVLLRAVDAGTELTLVHRDVPDDQADDYEQGWLDHYFEPMHAYFAARSKPAARKPAKKRSKKPAAKKRR